MANIIITALYFLSFKLYLIKLGWHYLELPICTKQLYFDIHHQFNEFLSHRICNFKSTSHELGCFQSKLYLKILYLLYAYYSYLICIQKLHD